MEQEPHFYDKYSPPPPPEYSTRDQLTLRNDDNQSVHFFRVIYVIVMYSFVGFEVLTAVVIKIAILWSIAPCNPYMNRRFRGTYHLHLQSRKFAKQQTSESRWLDWRWKWYVPPKRRFIYGLQGAISQKMAIFMYSFILVYMFKTRGFTHIISDGSAIIDHPHTQRVATRSAAIPSTKLYSWFHHKVTGIHCTPMYRVEWTGVLS
jgi:hypothetical protein